ncbi:MAG: TIGR00159 family protein [Anaerolineaceae bacterium]|nr:TIGR00159 family protein [Anaerolineaceae bacterium]
MESIRSYLNRLVTDFDAMDVVEFLLIALVVYTVYRFLRGTRGARVFRGFVFLLITGFVLVQLLASLLDMQRVQIIYNVLIQLAVVAAVIIFQPELRRAMIQLGQNPLFRFFLKKEGIAFIDILCGAVEHLSRDKIGAIIAVERDTGLLGLVESGRILNAELTPEMLVTIFWPGSPLHDMGVIIRQNRIVAAGCEFPLTQNPPLGPKYGARHRAALGLSEDSDAVVIIVSEETGEISIALEGRLIENLPVERFRRVLTQMLVREQSSSNVASAMGLTAGAKTDKTMEEKLEESEE